MTTAENGETFPPASLQNGNMRLPTPEICHRALQTRDRAFDGHLFVGVTSTGIYCRPVCPAKTAKFENCKFFQSSAAALEAGFRPCLTCHPELAPEIAGRDGAKTTRHALDLISEGFFDQEDATVNELANRLGVSEQDLNNLFESNMGARPSAVGRAHRILFAKQLIHETSLSLPEVATAAGFSDPIHLEQLFKKLFRRHPLELRRRKTVGSSSTAVTLHVAYQSPYDWESVLAYLNARAIEGIEEIKDGCYRRTFSLDGKDGVVEVTDNPRRHGLRVTIQMPHLPSLSSVLFRIRRMFDLHAEMNSIERHLLRDLAFGQLIAERPNLRIPGGWDGFELAIRGILNQQNSAEAARQLASKLVKACGRTAMGLPSGKLCYIFPTPQQIASSDLSGLGLPESRQKTLKALAELAERDPRFFDACGTSDEVISQLQQLPGVGRMDYPASCPPSLS